VEHLAKKNWIPNAYESRLSKKRGMKGKQEKEGKKADYNTATRRDTTEKEKESVNQNRILFALVCIKRA